MKRAIVDKNLCIGCGLCAEVCPQVFGMGDDNIAQVKTDPIPQEAEDSCHLAADQCPGSAIQIQEY
jgi:ferredoxin